MRERVFQYLEQARKAVPSDQILSDALNIRSLNRLAAGRVLDGILAQDPRFQRDARGFWRTAAAFPQDPPVALSHRATLFIQFARGRIDDLFVRGAIHFLEKDRAWEFALAGVPSPGTLNATRAEADGRILAVWSPGVVKRWNYLLRRCALPAWNGETIYIEALAARTLRRCPSLEDLSGHLGVSPADADRPAAMARYLDDCLTQLIEMVPQQHRQNISRLQQWLDAGQEKIDFSRFNFGPDLLARIPGSPGVYVMKNREGDVLYVGKARNLKGRARTYFTSRALKDSRVARIHQALHSLELFSTPSEIEALLLEMRLIRKFHPSINIQTEVHARGRSYGREDNLVVLVPEPESGKAEAYFLCQGSFVGQLSIKLGREPGRRVTKKLQSIYFGSRGAKKLRREPWELELVSRWIAANRKRLNCVDVDEAGSFDTVVRQLSQYLKDPDLLSRKVYYR
jgi:GIY-YIG catalytic domain